MKIIIALLFSVLANAQDDHGFASQFSCLSYIESALGKSELSPDHSARIFADEHDIYVFSRNKALRFPLSLDSYSAEGSKKIATGVREQKRTYIALLSLNSSSQMAIRSRADIEYTRMPNGAEKQTKIKFTTDFLSKKEFDTVFGVIGSMKESPELLTFDPEPINLDILEKLDKVDRDPSSDRFNPLRFQGLVHQKER